DRVAVLVKKEKNILTIAEDIEKKIEEDIRFMPEIVLAFKSVAAKEHFWLDVIDPFINRILIKNFEWNKLNFDINGIKNIANFFSHIIDFRSRFTATHSAGVTASARTLAKLCGMSEEECHLMEIAGFLHDIGKLSIPNEILEKPGQLTKEEFNIIKTHSYFTYRILENIPSFNKINEWSAYHHERLDGRGYPFRLNNKDLSLGSRILAVADIFTAIKEDRPYRKGMSKFEIIEVLDTMALNSAVDGDIVEVLKNNYVKISEFCIISQDKALQDYKNFENKVKNHS
ncbi:MAG: HD domain-containing protein, partial [Desulfobacterales bacterium]|nr:HD domain-containing protein [Desulfobacterales bacterium]